MIKTNGKHNALFFGLALVLGFFTSCASTSGTGKKIKYNEAAYRQAMMDCDYITAYSMLNSINQKKITIAQQIDKGVLEYYLGDYTAANETFKVTLQRIDDAQINQNEMEDKVGSASSFYIPPFYETLLADTFDALTYYRNGDLDSAMSRTTRAYNKLDAYNVSEIRQEISEPEEAVINENTKNVFVQALAAVGIPGATALQFIMQFQNIHLPKAPTENDIYKGSAFAAYIRMLITAINNSERDENVEKILKQLAKGVETDAAGISNSPNGRIEVLALSGSINQKQDEVIFIDAESLVRAIAEIYAATQGLDSYVITRLLTAADGQMGYNIHYPKYVRQEPPSPVARKITLSDGTTKEPVLLEDFDLAVLQDVNMTARKTVKRNLAVDLSAKTPLFASQTATYMMTAKQVSGNPMADILLVAAMKGFVEAFANVDPKADLRQSMALPSKAYCAGFTVAPGIYSVTVEYDNGSVETIDNVVVQAGKPVLVESVCK